MTVRHRLLFLGMILCLIASFAFAEPAAATLSTDGWKWDAGTVNTFSGIADLSAHYGDELTVRVSAELRAGSGGTLSADPVFSNINGKRIGSSEQESEFRFTPSSDLPSLRFTGLLEMPENDTCTGVDLQVAILDAEGKELIRMTGSESRSIASSSGSSSVFRIPVDIRTVTVIAAAAAALVWCIVGIREWINQRNRRNNHADF